MNQTGISTDNLERIPIPITLGERLGLSSGMTLVVEQTDSQHIWLRRIQPAPPPLVDKDGILVAVVEPCSDLTNIVRNERDRRIFDLLQRGGL